MPTCGNATSALPGRIDTRRCLIRSTTRAAVEKQQPADFAYDATTGICTCPAGKRLYQNGSNCRHNGLVGVKFQGAQRDCMPCTLRDKCLRTPERTKTRQVVFFRGRSGDSPARYTDAMRQRIDSEEGRKRYGQRAWRRWSRSLPTFGTKSG